MKYLFRNFNQKNDAFGYIRYPMCDKLFFIYNAFYLIVKIIISKIRN